MAGKFRRGNAKPVSDLVSAIVDPVLQKRTGVSLALVQCWDEIVGAQIAESSRPEKIAWRRRASDETAFEPATLLIACEGIAALTLQHQSSEVIARVNAFLGYPAIDRVKIMQKPVRPLEPQRRRRLRALSKEEQRQIDHGLIGIEDGKLRAALQKLGAAVLASRG